MFELELARAAFGSVHSLQSEGEWDETWLVARADLMRTLSADGGGLWLAEQQIRRMFTAIRRPSWLGLLHALSAKVTQSIDHGAETLDLYRTLRRIFPHEMLTTLVPVPVGGSIAAVLSDPLREVLCRDLGDAHVHSGGATPLGTSLEIFASYAAAESMMDGANLRLPTLHGRDALATDIDLYPLALGLVWAAAVASGGVDQWEEVALRDGGVAGSLAVRGTLWLSVAKAALGDQSLKSSLISNLTEGIRNLRSAEFSPSLPMLCNRFTDAALAVPPYDQVAGSPFSILLRGSVVTLCVLQSALTSPLRTSLSNFAARFRLQSDFRKALRPVTNNIINANEPTQDADIRRIAGSLRHLSVGSPLRRLELRKTISLGATSAREEVASDVKAHLAATARVLADEGHRLVVQMPVSFLRHDRPAFGPEQAIVPGARIHRYPLLEALALAQGVAGFLSTHQALVGFIGGVDVAGDEWSTPNWVFGIAFQYLESLLRKIPTDESLVYSVHAGESFANPLHGLRRVGETQLMGVRIARIGHALALDAHQSRLGGVSTSTQAEALDDLCWALHMAERYDLELEAVIQDEASSWIKFLTPRVYGVAVPRNVAIAAYLNRFSTSAMARVGVSAVQSPLLDDEISHWPPTEFAPRICNSLADAALSSVVFEGLAIWRTGPDLVRLTFDNRSSVPAETVGALTELSEALATKTRPLLMEYLRQPTDDESRIIIECCPSSNIAIGGYDGFDGHPLPQFAAAGLACTVSSDDPGIFCTRVEDELAAIAVAGRFEPDQLDQLRLQSLEATAMGISASTAEDYAKLLEDSFLP